MNDCKKVIICFILLSCAILLTKLTKKTQKTKKSIFYICILFYFFLVAIHDWNVLDPQIAGWLLDPDNPTSSFEDSLKSVNLSYDKVWYTSYSFIVFTLLRPCVSKYFR